MEGWWTDSILWDPSSQAGGSNNLFSASEWWEYTKSCFKENAKISSKNSTNKTTKHTQKRKLHIKN